jgi:plasmid stability protein
MSQITLRNLPVPLEREIRQEARRRGSSLNKAIIGILEKGLGMDSRPDKKRDLASLAGTWDEAALREFQDATSVFETIDAENWQS